MIILLLMVILPFMAVVSFMLAFALSICGIPLGLGWVLSFVGLCVAGYFSYKDKMKKKEESERKLIKD